MTYETAISLFLFALVTRAIPGPNNIMLLTSGANYGWIKTVPHIIGVILGVTLLLICVALGLSNLLNLYPKLTGWLQIIALSYLAFLSWQIAFSKAFTQITYENNSMSTEEAAQQTQDKLKSKAKQQSKISNLPKIEGKPLSFAQVLLFQLINPKAWSTSLSVTALYVDHSNPVFSVLLVGLIFALAGIPGPLMWVSFGTILANFLKNPRRLKIFNITMGSLLILSIILIIL